MAMDDRKDGRESAQPPLTLEWVLRKAIQKEIAAWLLYNNLSRTLEPLTVQEAFAQLSQEEKRHQKLLEYYLKGEPLGGELGKSQVVEPEIAEHLEQPPIYPEMKPGETFPLAAQREKAAHDLYMALAAIHPPGEARALFEAMAAEELEHKQRVETLFAEVVFPQIEDG